MTSHDIRRLDAAILIVLAILIAALVAWLTGVFG